MKYLIQDDDGNFYTASYLTNSDSTLVLQGRIRIIDVKANKELTTDSGSVSGLKWVELKAFEREGQSHGTRVEKHKWDGIG